MLAPRDLDLARRCLAALEALPGVRVSLNATGDRLRLAGAWGQQELPVRILPRVSPQSLALVRAETDAAPLLLCESVGPRQAQQLKAAGQPFLDACGNAWLQAPPLYLEIAGRRAAAPPPRPGRAFTAAGLKLIYLLLRDPTGAGRTDYRGLAAEAGIALGAVGDILKELAAQHYLEAKGRRRRDLHRAEALLLRWQLGYLEQLRPRLLLQTCRPAPGQTVGHLPRTLKELGIGAEVLLGGELGATLLTGGGEAQRASLHLDRPEMLRLMLQLRLTPDPAGPVTLLQRFGSRNGWTGWQPDTAPLADPLLLSAELAAAGQAASPLALELHERYLRPRLAESG